MESWIDRFILMFEQEFPFNMCDQTQNILESRAL